MDNTKENAESICAVYNRCYEKAAGETLAAHKGFIDSAPKEDQRAVIHKDFEQIAHKINRALEEHLKTTDGYIGEFPKSKQYYATVNETDHYYFDYFRWCMYDRNALAFPLRRLDALVDQERFRMNVMKSALALAGAVVCIVLMWFCQGWFFAYEGFGVAKIGALALVFVGLLALIWWSSHDPNEFASQFDMDEESPVGYLCIGLVAAVLVRIFLSGAAAAMVCCVAAGMCGVCFLIRMLAAHKRVRQIQSCSPVLRKMSLEDCEHFERNAQRIYRLVRFWELWYERENIEENKQHMEYVHRSLMEYIEEYDQWCCKYLRNSDDAEV